MKIITNQSFYFQQTYILEMDGKLILIDPGFNLDKILEYIGNDKLEMILLTHFHFDHSASVDALCERYGIKAYIHEDDFDLLMNNKLAGSMGYGHIKTSEKNIRAFKDEIPELPSLKIIHAPGHSMGSVLFEYEDTLFTGDVIFANMYGRTDLEGSDNDKQMKTLKMFKEFRGDLHVYPGHGKSEKLKNIIRDNNFFKVL